MCIRDSNNGTCYAFYDDDAAGDTSAGNETMESPVIDISGYSVVELTYDWGFRLYGTNRMIVAVRFFSNVRGWSDYDTIAVYDVTGNGSESFVFAGADSMQILFEFQDPDGDWGWGCGFDNVMVKEYVYTPTPGDVIINEFKPKGQEWFELYNTLPITVPLTGWKFVDRSGNEVSLSGTIAGNSYYVDTLSSYVMDNGGDIIYLVASTGDTIDRVAYGSWGGAPVSETDVSVARVPDGNDTDDDARDFNLDFTPTPGAANDATGVDLGSSLVVNECDNYPASGDDMIELYNPTSTPIVLDTSDLSTTWYMTDGDDWSPINIMATINPGEVLCLYENTNFDFDVSSSDVVYLFNPDTVRVDQVGFYGEYEDGSFQRYPDGAGPNDGYDYLSSGGGVTWFDRRPLRVRSTCR